jgi:hypothetical protein
MKIEITPEILKVFRRKQTKQFVFNFSEGMIRVCSDEKLITGSTVSVYYHIPAVLSYHKKEEGGWFVSYYERAPMSTLIKLLKVGDVLSVTIDRNNTSELKANEFEWEMLNAEIYRKNDIMYFNLENCISKSWQYSKERYTWNEKRVNEFVQY